MGCPANGRKLVTIRTTRTTISFSQPFKLRDLDAIQPAGDYLLDTDEELIEGLSRLAYRRVATFLHLPSMSRPQGRAELLPVTQRNSMLRWRKIELAEFSARRSAFYALPHTFDRKNS
jgi:hypothetical protein